MKKPVIVLSLIALSVIAAQCTPKKVATKTPEAPAVAKTYTLAEMEEGKVIFEGNCGKCHTLYTPETRGVASWEKILPPMSRKAELTNDQAGKVRAYVLAHARI
jgi:mono/diheme cytochrome c family protein